MKNKVIKKMYKCLGGENIHFFLKVTQDFVYLKHVKVENTDFKESGVKTFYMYFEIL